MTDIKAEAEKLDQLKIDEKFVKAYRGKIEQKRRLQYDIKRAEDQIRYVDKQLDDLIQAYADGNFTFVDEYSHNYRGD